MDTTRPRTSNSFRTPHRPQRPKKNCETYSGKKRKYFAKLAVLPQTCQEGNPEEDLKDYAHIDMDALKYEQETQEQAV
ncbi:hypothetical protein Tco_0847917 [Tanacetum coccineum]